MPEIDLSNLPNKIVESLQLLVADLYSLTALAHNLHWNVEGPNFTEYHEYFGGIYSSAFEDIDGVAEQARKIGSYVKVDLAAFKQVAGFPEITAPFVALDGFKVLLTAFEKYKADLNAAIEISGKFGDLATQQIILDLKTKTDKEIWFIKSILK